MKRWGREGTWWYVKEQVTRWATGFIPTDDLQEVLWSMPQGYLTAGLRKLEITITNSPQSLAQDCSRVHALLPKLYVAVVGSHQVWESWSQRHRQGTGSPSYTRLALLEFERTFCIWLRICTACLNNCYIWWDDFVSLEHLRDIGLGVRGNVIAAPWTQLPANKSTLNGMTFLKGSHRGQVPVLISSLNSA